MLKDWSTFQAPSSESGELIEEHNKISYMRESIQHQFPLTEPPNQFLVP